MFFHFLKIQELRTFLDFKRQLFLHIIFKSFKLGMMPILHIFLHFISFLLIFHDLFIPEIIKGLELVLMSPSHITMLLLMFKFHFINSPRLQILFKLFRCNSQVLSFNIVPIFLVLVHLGKSMIQQIVKLISRFANFDITHLSATPIKIQLISKSTADRILINTSTYQNINKILMFQSLYLFRQDQNIPILLIKKKQSSKKLTVKYQKYSQRFHLSYAIQYLLRHNNQKLYKPIEMLASFYDAVFGPKIVDNQEYFRLTYRSKIHKMLPTTKYTSDTGWGCMLRVLQMAIANLLVKREGADPKSIASLFWDNSLMPFSIQTLSKLSTQLFPHKKDCQWYSPSEAGFLIQKTLEHFNTTYRVAVCNDGSIFLNELPTDKQNLVVLVMARIGLEKPEPQYLNVLMNMMETKYFFAVLGGTPRYAHLFLKHKKGYLGMLDPHETFKAAENQEELISKTNEYTGKLEWVKKQKISSSMCIMFVMNREEIESFWAEMNQLREKSGEDFFLFLADEKPVYDSDDIQEILEFQ